MNGFGTKSAAEESGPATARPIRVPSSNPPPATRVTVRNSLRLTWTPVLIAALPSHQRFEEKETRMTRIKAE
jgi:hypothetical protein